MSPLLFYIALSSLLLGSALSMVQSDIINHAAAGGRGGTRDAESHYNSLFLKVSSQQVVDRAFVKALTEAVERDGCSASFSGVGERALTNTLYCPGLGNRPRMSVQERKPLPALTNTRALLAQRSFRVDDYEYLGEYNKPASFVWYGSYEKTDEEMRLYWERLAAQRVRGREPRPTDKYYNVSSSSSSLYHVNYIENMAPWDLDRIDMRTGLLDNEYHYNNLGDAIDIYVIDTGIRATHQEFQGRANFLINTVGDNVSGDCVGHGTNVASLAAGVTYGVAKGAQLWDVKALGCNGGGDTFTIVTGIMAILEQAAARLPGRRAVVSMSLGGDYSTAINNAVLSLVQANIPVVVAAGNEYADACDFSPSAMGTSAGVLAVGASDIADTRPAWSNYGACVGITAPGVEDPGAFSTSDTATASLSGTSMSTPLVSGVAALVLNQNLTLLATQVTALIQEWATTNIVIGASSNGGGKNLLYAPIDITQQAPPPTTAPPSIPPDSVPSSSSHVTTVVSPLFLFISLLGLMLTTL